MSSAHKLLNSRPPPIWLGVLAIIIVLAIVGYVIIYELNGIRIGDDGKDGFYGGPRRYLGGYWYDHYPYPPHSYGSFYNHYAYPPPNPYLYPGAYHPRYSYYGGPYGSMYYGGTPRYIPYDPLDTRLPLPLDGHTTSYYYDRYKRHADANKANNPYKYHYDAKGELIHSEDAKYYDHQPWNQPTPKSSWLSWWSGWIY